MPTISIKVTINTRRFFAPSDKEASMAFGAAFKKQGYIVISTRPGPQYKIGDRINNIWGYETRRSFVVTEFTTERDCERQLNFMSKTMNRWARTPLDYAPGTCFYRVVPWTSKIAKQLSGGGKAVK